MSRQPEDDLTPSPRSTRFERIAVAVGDLDSPFYDEERDRDVWNEACAVGFQLLLWGIPLVGAASLWIAGAPALPVVLAMMLAWGLASAVTLTYAKRQGVDPNNAEALAGSSTRLWLNAVVMAALTSGVFYAARELPRDSNLESFVRGAATGSAVAFLVVTVIATIVLIRNSVKRRKHASDDHR